MDRNNSYNFFGKIDYDEDEDVYKPYNIKIKNNENKNIEDFNTSKESNKIPLAVNLSITKRMKKKPIVLTEKIENVRERKIQQAEFSPRPFEEPVEEGMSAESSLHSEEKEKAENSYTKFLIPNVGPFYGAQPTQPINVQPNFYLPLFPNMVNQAHVNYLARVRPLNPCIVAGNPLRQPVVQNQIDFIPNTNYSLTSTYMTRLHIVESLFRFIMQILRTPEPPPLQQIESLKHMLDSLVVPNPFDVSGAMK